MIPRSSMTYAATRCSACGGIDIHISLEDATALLGVLSQNPNVLPSLTKDLAVALIPGGLDV